MSIGVVDTVMTMRVTNTQSPSSLPMKDIALWRRACKSTTPNLDDSFCLGLPRKHKVINIDDVLLRFLCNFK